MQIAHDGQILKCEKENQRFSLYFRLFGKGIFMQKSRESTSRFWLLTGWPLGERKKRKIVCGKHKKVSFSENGKK